MPIHLDDLDVSSELAGVDSALIVPCNLCPAVTVAVRDEEPFLQVFKNGLKSAPFERYIKGLQTRLRELGVKSTVFESNLPHQWFACMWTSGRRRKLGKAAREYEAAIVLGCDTATETVRESVASTDCKVIEGMAVSSLMNAKLKFRFPCNLSFDECRTVAISHSRREIGHVR
jgi:hypothetical protein